MKKVLRTLGSIGLFLLALAEDFIFFIVDSIEGKNSEAKWGKESDIGSRWNHGFLYANHKRLSWKVSRQNLILVAPSGMGKTSGFLIKQTLVLQNVSMVITDPAKEIFNAVSGILQKDFTIITLNFSNAKESNGRFNFLAMLTGPNDMGIYKISDMLVRGSLEKGGNSDPFWSLSVKSLLNILIKLVMYQPAEQRHMASVTYALSILATEPDKFDLAIVNTADKKLLESYKECISTPERTFMNILASSRAALECFNSDSVQVTTSSHNISLSEIRKKPHIIFLHHSPSEGKMLAGLIGLFFELLYGHFLDTPVQKTDLDLVFLLEELGNNYIKILPEAMSMTRKAHISTFGCVQSLSQLRAKYNDDATTLLENCLTKIFLAGITAPETLKQVSELAGKIEVMDKHTGHYKTINMIEPSSIRTLGKDKTLILSGRNNLIMGRMSGYYKSLKFKAMTKYPPMEISTEGLNDTVQLMDFDKKEVKDEDQE